MTKFSILSVIPNLIGNPEVSALNIKFKKYYSKVNKCFSILINSLISLMFCKYNMQGIYAWIPVFTGMTNLAERGIIGKNQQSLNIGIIYFFSISSIKSLIPLMGMTKFSFSLIPMISPLILIKGVP